MSLAFSANLRALQTHVDLIYNKVYGSYQPKFDPLFDSVTSTDRKHLFAWPTRMLRMREWIGDRVLNGVESFEWEVLHKTYELSFAALQEDIEDDNLGMWDQTIAGIAQAAAVHKDDFAVSLLQSTTGLCYDGLSWWNASHPINPKNAADGTFTNLRTSFALTPANFETAYYAGSGLLGSDGLPMNIQYTHLVVPPQLGAMANRIIKSDLINETVTASTAAAVSNVNKGLCEVIIAPQLANEATTWYLLDLSKPIKPLQHLTRRPIVFKSMFNLEDPNVFFKREFVFGLDGRDSATVSLPQLALRATA